MLKLSPSSLDRVSRCPGSYWAEKRLFEPQNELQAEGNLLHDIMSGKVHPSQANLTGEQKRLIVRCGELGRELYQIYLGTGPITIEKERQLQAELGMVTLSGVLDHVARDYAAVLVIDFKFGRTPVDPAEINKQMRSYAMMAWKEYITSRSEPEDDGKVPVRVIVAVVQPTVDRDSQLTVAQYSSDDIVQAYDELHEMAERIQACEHTNNARYPGPIQCKYCKAIGTKRCPESTAIATELVKIQAASILPTGYPLADLWEKLRTIEPMIAKVKEHAKEEARAGRMPGWKVSEPKPERSLPDTDACWQRVADHLDASEFIKLTSIGVGDLQEALQKRLGWRARDASKEFNTLMGATIQMKTRDGSLQRDPEWKPPVQDMRTLDEIAGDPPSPDEASGAGADEIGSLIALAADSPIEDCMDGTPDQIRASIKASEDAGVPLLFSDADENGPLVIAEVLTVHEALKRSLEIAASKPRPARTAQSIMDRKFKGKNT